MESIRISEYTYALPEEKIALFPLEQRDQSKLLVYEAGKIKHSKFRELDKHLSSPQALVFNNTRVIPARLFFRKSTGAMIEIFLLEPVIPGEMTSAMSSIGECSWQCTIGNLKKWKGQILTAELGEFELQAILTDREKQIVTFRWSGGKSFSSIIEQSGKIPLPPYIKREAEEEDLERYQTVYSKPQGAVAAPTAGLHFTPAVISGLQKEGHSTGYLTLHVGAGTFQPIKSTFAAEHDMHGEKFNINKEVLEYLSTQSNICAVGTTSLRTLESVYWHGIKMMHEDKNIDFIIEKDDYHRYSQLDLPDYREVFSFIAKYGKFKNGSLSGETRIFIYPGYTFRVVSALITNFHMPGSTLILLIAAFIGEDWRKVYQSALENDYRFLSYGDSSILYRK